MQNARKITDDLFFIGGNDRKIALFENIYPVPRGISYNSYLLKDEKTVLFDTVDYTIGRQFFENLTYVLEDRSLDYMIINHMEPDHAAMIEEVIRRYPEVQLVCNAKAEGMIKQFFDFEVKNIMLVKEKDTLSSGKHTLTFMFAPMVHWPEVMVTYDTTDKVLFSADAFGTFGALNGNLFADEVDFEGAWLEDARRYYTNIVGKYGVQTQALLKKAAEIEIEMICPLHGPIWRQDISWFIEKYQRWSTYTPEDATVMIAYASIYGNTENAAEILAAKLADKGVKKIALYDVSNTEVSTLVSEAFRCSHLVFASATYNGGIFPLMETLLLELKAHNLQNRKIAVMQNGTWAATAGKQMKEILSALKKSELIEREVVVKSAVKEAQIIEIEELAEILSKDLGTVSIDV